MSEMRNIINTINESKPGTKLPNPDVLAQHPELSSPNGLLKYIVGN